jgi:hypothetical protein
MIYARKAEGQPVSEHYEITTELGLSDWLAFLEPNIGLQEGYSRHRANTRLPGLPSRKGSTRHSVRIGCRVRMASS